MRSVDEGLKGAERAAALRRSTEARRGSGAGMNAFGAPAHGARAADALARIRHLRIDELEIGRIRLPRGDRA